LESLGLAKGDKLDIVLVGDRSNVDATVVEAGKEENRGQVSQLSIGDDRLVCRPRIEVSSDSSNLADVAREVVERDEERANLAGNMADLVSIVRGSGHREVVVTVATPSAVLLSGLQSEGISDGAINT
jgi:hypothetical protein